MTAIGAANYKKNDKLLLLSSLNCLCDKTQSLKLLRKTKSKFRNLELFVPG